MGSKLLFVSSVRDVAIFRGSIVIAIRFEQDALIRKFFVKVLDKHRLVNIPRVCIKCNCIALIKS